MGPTPDDGRGLRFEQDLEEDTAWGPPGTEQAAGLSSAGLAGAVRTEGLALVYLNALRVWLADDTEDMEKTMAALDWGLRQAEMLMRLCGFGAPPGAGEAPPGG